MNEEADIEAKRRKEAANEALMSEVARWFEGKDFTTDWMTRKALRWNRLLHSLRDQPADVLEVGSFEGRSAVFLLNYLPRARVTCIDFFKGVLNERFDANLAPFRSRLTKLRGSAISHVDALARSGEMFDLIYLDAGKHRDHVLALSLLAWPLLNKRGYLIWDDYDWGLHLPPEERPRDGIDAFLKLHEGEYKVLWNKGQVFVQRTTLPAPRPGRSPINADLSY